MSLNCNNTKCYTIENISYNDLCSECKTMFIDILDKCNIVKEGYAKLASPRGHDISNIIIGDVLITHYINDDKIKIEKIKPTMDLTNIREIDFGSRPNNNFVIIMICKKLITPNDIWKQINKQLLSKLFNNRLDNNNKDL